LLLNISHGTYVCSFHFLVHAFEILVFLVLVVVVVVVVAVVILPASLVVNWLRLFLQARQQLEAQVERLMQENQAPGASRGFKRP